MRPTCLVLFGRRCVVVGKAASPAGQRSPWPLLTAGARPSLLAWKAMIRDLPDALVLGAGGSLGEAWLRGVLNGLTDGAGLDFRRCEYLLGTSAGSIVAATLAAGRPPEAGARAAREWADAAPVDDEQAPAGNPLLGPVARAGQVAARPRACAAP